MEPRIEQLGAAHIERRVEWICSPTRWVVAWSDRRLVASPLTMGGTRHDTTRCIKAEGRNLNNNNTHAPKTRNDRGKATGWESSLPRPIGQDAYPTTGCTNDSKCVGGVGHCGLCRYWFGPCRYTYSTSPPSITSARVRASDTPIAPTYKGPTTATQTHKTARDADGPTISMTRA